MSPTTLALVLSGALCHACWNILAKRAAGGAMFVWLQSVVSAFTLVPLALWLGFSQGQSFSTAMLWAALASGLVHVVYYLALQHGYRVGDFAVVYPVARGSGPMMSVLGAVLLLHELPSGRGWLGVALVLGGLFLSAGAVEMLRGGDSQRRLRGALWGLLTGGCIAVYTVVDGYAVKSLGAAPIGFYAMSVAVRALALAPWVLRGPESVAQNWRAHGLAIVLIAWLSPLAYVLVLYALQRAPLSYIAPVREISILIGVLLGARLVREALRTSQLLGAVLMLAGVVTLATA